MPTSTLTERKVYSQHGEDGILEWLIEKTGCSRKHIVEIGCGDGRECNSRNLVENHGWTATLADASLGDWITAENVHWLFYPPTGVLSIDVDGNDYWLWKAVTCNPDIVCIEYNSHFGHEPVTIPYDPSFQWKKNGHWYRGASLAALASLGSQKGYQLVGCESSGTNAFFVRREIGGGLPDCTPRMAFVAQNRPATGRIDLGALVTV